MKKIVCLLLALMMCFAAVALAENGAPSKTVDDMTHFDENVENPPEEEKPGPVIGPVAPGDEEKHKDSTDACDEELEKLKDKEKPEDYFGPLTDDEGNEVKIPDVTGTDKNEVLEFEPVIVEGYDKDMGDVTVDMEFATPYEEGEKVVVVVGTVTKDEDGNQKVDWTAYPTEGKGDGTLQVTLKPDILDKIQNGIGIVAVVSGVKVEPTPTPLPERFYNMTMPDRAVGIQFIDGQWVYVDEFGNPLGLVAQTGDNDNLPLVFGGMALLLAAAGVIAFAIVKKEKRKNS